MTKCVCPMGGDRICPDDCPIAIWASLSTTDRKAQRKPVAEGLYKQGFTQEQIATQLGVTQQQVSKDLSDLQPSCKLKPAKTASNPKGAGRPKGSKKPKEPRQGTRGKETPQLDAARVIVRDKLEANEPISPHKLQDEHGISHVTFDSAIYAELGRKEGIAEKTALDPTILSKTAQEKLDTAIRAHKSKLETEFHHRVNERVRQFIDDTILPDWRQKIEQANKLYEKRRGLMSKDVFNTIRRGLHPDSRNSISDKKLGEAFDAFMALEKYLLDEKDSPTKFGQDLPMSFDAAAKQKAAAARRAKQTSSRRHLQ